MAAYDVGDKIRLTETFTNLAGVVTDPTAVTFKMKLPNGTATTYVYGTDAQLVKLGTGIYYVDWTFTMADSHRYRFAGTGTVVASDEGTILVRRSFF